MIDCVVIYALIDPRNNQIRYVGKTENPLHRRLASHVYYANKGGKTYTCKLIRKWNRKGIKPKIVEIARVSRSWWKEAECICIEYLRNEGFRLTNLSSGGEGSSGYRHTKEARRRIGEASKGNTYGKGVKRGPITQETRDKISRALKGKLLSKEHKASLSKGQKRRFSKSFEHSKISESLKKRYILDPELKLKISEREKGKKASIETRLKMSVARKGKPHSVEHSLAISFALKGNTNSKGTVRSEETKKKVSEGIKKWWASRQ